MRSFLLSCFSLLLLPILQASHAASVHGGQGKVAAAWYAGWHATGSTPAFPVSEISWSKYTHMTYSFAETMPDVTRLNLSGSNPQVLPQFVEAAHKHGVKAIVSIGGWTGSRWFSSNLGSAVNRTRFVKTVTNFARKYHLDGLDFDWEFPGHQGVGCNTINAHDSANFLAFLEELRLSCGGGFILTAAAVSPFYGPNGTPSTNVAAFSRVLNWVAIMNYDVWGPWSPTVGPNSPLDDTCAAPSNKVGSAVSFVNAWEKAGMPRNQIVLGVAAYGHSFRVTNANAYKGNSLALYPPFDKARQPAGDSWDGAPGLDVCGNPVGPSGDVNFWGLIAQGYLNPDGTPRNGIDYIFDNCAKTAYVYNKKTEIMVSYDNVEAFKSKGGFIKSSGIRGFAMWEAGGDSKDLLLNAIRGSMGF